ncbi:hypothetical protein SAMN02799624_05317 [Paenibacillus sp. UNC496MF]|uniref:hypothetical protein n=1 Tax=Paenibacillus sp. UNC496MF TaxID=1502753 RepID=UPI0008EC465D|nr:hypothetical protein [Paenibacillus sp. UNC496MF]SFJ64049.1 hypothetical protein SAMN02799624_05317 [Paenibacillus sp. UNC496MF]
MKLWFSLNEFRHFLAGEKAVGYTEKNDAAGAIHPQNVMSVEREVEMGAGRIMAQKKI